MDTPEEIVKLAWQRLEEAQILFDNGRIDGAFYLAGYSVELMLKSKICNLFGVPNLFVDSKGSDKEIITVRNAVKTHNLITLLIFSGLKNRFDKAKSEDVELFKSNSLLFSIWDEKARYKPCGHFKSEEVGALLKLLSKPDGLLQWIEKN